MSLSLFLSAVVTETYFAGAAGASAAGASAAGAAGASAAGASAAGAAGASTAAGSSTGASSAFFAQPTKDTELKRKRKAKSFFIAIDIWLF